MKTLSHIRAVSLGLLLCLAGSPALAQGVPCVPPEIYVERGRTLMPGLKIESWVENVEDFLRGYNLVPPVSAVRADEIAIVLAPQYPQVRALAFVLDGCVSGWGRLPTDTVQRLIGGARS